MHYVMLYPQNGDRIVTIDSVTSLLPLYLGTQTALTPVPLLPITLGSAPPPVS